MPIPVVLVCSAISLFFLVRQFRFILDWPSRLLMIFLWVRWTLAGMHPLTTTPKVAGQSIIALVTLAMIGLLVLAIRRRDLRAPHLVIFIPMVLLAVVSGVYNLEIKGLINELVGWTVFTCVLILTLDSARINGLDRTMRGVLCATITPVLLQLGTIVTRRSVGGELDGTISFIGGYPHESVISRILFFFLISAILIQWRTSLIRVGLLIYTSFAIYMSNYRTTIIATLPVTLTVLTTWSASLFSLRYRMSAILTMIILGTLVIGSLIPLLPPRYAQIFEVIANADRLIQPAIEFTAEERKYFSYRAIFWANYIGLWLQGDPIQLLIGYGPFSYDDIFKLSAHSTYVSYIFEFGLVGVFYLIFIFLYNLTYCFQIQGAQQKATLLALHVGFMILNLTTVAMKAIEGMMVYALIMAATLALVREAALLSASSQLPSPMRSMRPAE